MKIGLLHDSVSLATGIRATSRVVQRAFAANDIAHRVVDPMAPVSDDLAMLVIGGGMLLRAPDDPVYRAFRVRGRHVLHSVSVGDARDTDYLDDYACVAVRARADRNRLGRGIVCPSLSLLYGDYRPADIPIAGVPDGAIGIHVTPAMRDHALGFVHVLSTLGVGPVVWLPTADLRGRDLLETLHSSLPGSVVLPGGDPDALWNIVGRLRALVTPSLHAAGFAYAQRTPFLTYGYGSELGDFLRDRDLTDCQLSIATDLQRQLPNLLERSDAVPDPTADLESCRQLLDEIIAVAAKALLQPQASIHIDPIDQVTYNVQRELARVDGAGALEAEAQRLRVRNVEAALDRIQYQASQRSLVLEASAAERSAILVACRNELDGAYVEIEKLRLATRGDVPAWLRSYGQPDTPLDDTILQPANDDLAEEVEVIAESAEVEPIPPVPVPAVISEVEAEIAESEPIDKHAEEFDALVGEIQRRDRLIDENLESTEALSARFRETASRLAALENIEQSGQRWRSPMRWLAHLLGPFRRWSRMLLRRTRTGEFGMRFGIETNLEQTRWAGRGGALHITGWCFVPDARVTSLTLMVDGRAQVIAEHSQPRLDVLAVFYPNHESTGASLLSGFSTIIDIPAIDVVVSLPLCLRAQLDNGDIAECAIGTLQLLPGDGREPLPGNWTGAGAKIAICMTTCDPPPELFEQQIRSIAEQDHDNFICIIQDDVSSESNLAAIKHSIAGDTRFVLFQNDARMGFYRNFETCLMRVPADAEFVALSDHDDRWYADKLSSLLAAFDDDTQLVYSDCRLVQPDGTVLAESYWTRRRNNYTDLSTMFVANTVTGAASLFRADLLDQTLPFPQRVGDAYHDQWLGLLAMVKGRIGYVDRPLYDYMQHGRNVIGAVELRAAGVTDAIHDVFSTGFHPARVVARLRNFIMSASADHAFVTHKALVSRMLLRRFPDVSGARRRVLRRFRDINQSIPAILGTMLRARLGNRPTLNMDGYMLRAAIGQRLSRPGFRLRRRLLLEGRSNEQAVLDRVSGVNTPPAAPPSGADVAASERVSAIGFGNVGWMSHNIRPLTLASSPKQPRRVNLLLATIDFRYVFGGYIGMFNLALFLKRMGHQVRIVLTESVDYRPEEWRRQIQKFPGLESLFDDVEVAPRFDRTDPLPVNPDDAFVATSCWTAHVAHHAVRELGHERFVFMVQEYEPIFTSYNSINAIFRQAYDFPQYALFSTAILQDYFRAERIGVYMDGEESGDALSAVFHNAICRFTPKLADMVHEEKRLLFYARPEDHAARNLFELGVMGLVELLRRDDVDLTGWTFHGIGSIDRRYVLELAPGIDLKLLPRTSLDEYIQLLPTFDVGLSLMMSPHPSLVPLEMAAAGLRTVTNTFANKTAVRLAAVSPNLIAVPPTVDGIADGLAEAIRRAGDLKGRLADARIDWPTNWTDAFSPETMQRLQRFLEVEK
ncbi:MAG: glycosyltransferase [Dokdonella sp.]